MNERSGVVGAVAWWSWQMELGGHSPDAPREDVPAQKGDRVACLIALYRHSIGFPARNDYERGVMDAAMIPNIFDILAEHGVDAVDWEAVDAFMTQVYPNLPPVEQREFQHALTQVEQAFGRYVGDDVPA